ncbi:hypothetical protein M0R45_026729 [Rubus argutus]|uniref:Transmembrane protein n=1 Tax=Rubus argutus TaxID=59490 RepID=A0AAW1X0V3_RUBAR
MAVRPFFSGRWWFGLRLSFGLLEDGVVRLSGLKVRYGDFKGWVAGFWFVVGWVYCGKRWWMFPKAAMLGMGTRWSDAWWRALVDRRRFG